jgi:hypothetical protein
MSQKTQNFDTPKSLALQRKETVELPPTPKAEKVKVSSKLQKRLESEYCTKELAR